MTPTRAECVELKKPQPPAGLAPGTREHRFRWLTTMLGYTPEQARAEFAQYEQRMNSAAWERYRSELREWESHQGDRR